MTSSAGSGRPPNQSKEFGEMGLQLFIEIVEQTVADMEVAYDSQPTLHCGRSIRTIGLKPLPAAKDRSGKAP